MLSVSEKLLRVSARHFVAGAVWIKDERGDWRCTHAAPIVKWMVGSSPAAAVERMRRSGYSWEWVGDGLTDQPRTPGDPA
mgnify:CR=1 FL=1